MPEDKAQKPLEVRVLSNISYLQAGRNRMFCQAAIISVVEQVRPGDECLMVRGYNGSVRKGHVFTGFHYPDEKVSFKNDGQHGELIVGNEVYNVAAGDKQEAIVFETKQFPDVNAQWDYLDSLLRRS